METVVDTLVVKLVADDRNLETGIKAADGSIKELALSVEKAKDGMAELNAQGMETAKLLKDAFGDLVGELGNVFTGFARTGEFSFAKLRDAAVKSLKEVAQSILQSGLNQLTGQSGNSFLSSLVSAFSRRETGGPVNPQRAFLVGERGPELFIPPSQGRIAPLSGVGSTGVSPGRPISVTVNINNNSPQIMGRESAGQIALAVRRAVQRAARDQ